ncbi:hypothetical protein AAC387_Pa02g3480 [Persea americana]
MTKAETRKTTTTILLQAAPIPSLHNCTVVLGIYPSEKTKNSIFPIPSSKPHRLFINSWWRPSSRGSVGFRQVPSSGILGQFEFANRARIPDRERGQDAIQMVDVLVFI